MSVDGSNYFLLIQFRLRSSVLLPYFLFKLAKATDRAVIITVLFVVFGNFNSCLRLISEARGFIKML